MAGHVTSRSLLVYTIPSIIAFLSLLWFRRWRQKFPKTLPSETPSAGHCNSSTKDSVVCCKSVENEALKASFVEESNVKESCEETSLETDNEALESFASPHVEGIKSSAICESIETKVNKPHDSKDESILREVFPKVGTDVTKKEIKATCENKFDFIINENDYVQERIRSDSFNDATCMQKNDIECLNVHRNIEETCINDVNDHTCKSQTPLIVEHKKNNNEDYEPSSGISAALGDCGSDKDTKETGNSKIDSCDIVEAEELCVTQSDCLYAEQESLTIENSVSSSEESKEYAESSETSRNTLDLHSDFDVKSEIVDNFPPHAIELTLQSVPVEDVKKEEELVLHSPVTVHSFPPDHHSGDISDSPPHSIYSDIHSEGSSDSGKGGSDIQFGSDLTPNTCSEVSVYEFELPQDLCGRLIGRMGKQVKYIKDRSNANIFIKKHPFSAGLKLCAVEGTLSEIQSALDLIRQKFPPSQFPSVTLSRVNVPTTCGVPIPETLQLHLPEGVTCNVILSSLVSAGHFFLQQPTHPTYPSLSQLDQCMLACYSQVDTPQLPQPIETGIICAATIMNGWYRAQVINVHENTEECDVKFVDYGGYSQVPNSSLRQIRSDFMTLPFQAAECYLANVKPVDEETGWSLEACATFEELAQGQILQSVVAAYAEDGLPCVQLYRVQGVSTMLINRELVNRGVAQWIEHQTLISSSS